MNITIAILFYCTLGLGRGGVQILFRMLKEVVRFGLVIGVILLGFSMAMFALFGGRAPPAYDGDDSTSSSSPETVPSSGTTSLLR